MDLPEARRGSERASETKHKEGRQAGYSPCILADHHPVSWLLSPPRRSVPIAVLPLGLVQAAASHAATHEQVNHASRGHKPRAIRGDAAHKNGRRARRGRRTVGEASSAHGRPLCVIGAYQRPERIFAEVGHEAEILLLVLRSLCQQENKEMQFN